MDKDKGRDDDPTDKPFGTALSANFPSADDSSSIAIASTSKSEVLLSEWNYEADLNRVKFKLREASDPVKEEIRDLIKRALNVDEIDGILMEENARSYDSELTSTMIRETCLLLTCFRKFYRDKEKEEKQGLNTIQSNLSEHESGAGHQLAIRIIKDGLLNNDSFNSGSYQALESLQKAWTSLELFFKRRLQKTWASFEQFCKSDRHEHQKSSQRALGIDLIIQEIQYYLPFKDLLNSRLINKTWNKNAVWIYGKNSNFACVVNNMKKFVSDPDFVITSASIFKRVETNLETNSLEDCVKFFAMIGPYVKDLAIKEAEPEPGIDEVLQCSTIDYQMRFKSLLQTNIPQLETLTLWFLPASIISEDFVIKPEDRKETVLERVQILELAGLKDAGANFTEGLFATVPNVQVTNIFWKQSTEHHEALAAALNKLKLTEMRIGCPLPPTQFWAKMSNQRLRLLHIEFKRDTLEDPTELPALQQFFESQSDTLEELYLDGNEDFGDESKIKLPIMKRLTHLEIRRPGFLFTRFEAKRLPNLSTLIICALDCIDYFSPDDIFPTVHTLEFLGPDQTDSSYLDFFVNVGELFPNLQNLKSHYIPLLDSCLTTMFSYSNLEKLDLVIHHLFIVMGEFNNTLSGFPYESSWVTSQLVATNSVEKMTTIEPPQFGLKHLQRLRKLKFTFKAIPGNFFKIDEVGVELGFLFLPQLDLLEMYGDFSISEDYVAHLSQYHSCVILERNQET